MRTNLPLRGRGYTVSSDFGVHVVEHERRPRYRRKGRTRFSRISSPSRERCHCGTLTTYDHSPRGFSSAGLRGSNRQGNGLMPLEAVNMISPKQINKVGQDSRAHTVKDPKNSTFGIYTLPFSSRGGRIVVVARNVEKSV